MYQMLFTALVREWLCCAKSTLAVLELLWISGWRLDEVQNQVCGLKSNSTNFVFPHLIFCYLSLHAFSPSLSALLSFSNLLSSLSLLYLISPFPSLCPLYLSPIVPCLQSSFMLGLAGWLLHTAMGMHTDVQICAGCMCVQEEQAADSWAKAKTYALLGEGDSEEEREVDWKVHKGIGRRQDRGRWCKIKLRGDEAREGWQIIKEVGDKIRKNGQMHWCAREERE